MVQTCPRCGESAPDDGVYCNFCGANLTTGVRPPPRPVGQSPGNNSNVKTCYYCGKPLTGEDALYFHCRYCGQDFCSAHRLPESHLCKSNPVRRTLPSTSSPYYTTGGGYTSSTYNPRRSGGGFLNISKQGKYLAILIVAGLAVGFIMLFLPNINGIPFLYYFLQDNYLAYQGWIVGLVTSIIVAAPNSSGLIDVFFNAISVIFIDGLLRQTYSFRQYFIIFFVTGVVGNIVSLFGYGPGYGPGITTLSFGASGGIFGLVAGAVSADYVMNRRLNPTLVIWFIFIFFYSTFLSNNIDIYAHLGGALTGLVAGYFAGRSRSNFRRFRY